MAETAERNTNVQSVERACLVLDALATARVGRSALELSKEIRLHRTIVHRLLRTLLGVGLVVEESSGRYALGPRALTLGYDYLDGLAIRKIAAPYMLDLSASTVGDRPWAVSLGVPVGDVVILIERIWTKNAPVTSLLAIGARLPMTRSAAGYCLLGAMPPAEVERRFGDALSPELRARIDVVREQHVGFASDEFSPGISAVAAPIFDGSGPVAALIVSGHDMQSELSADSRLVNHLLRVAHLIGDVLTTTGSGSSSAS